MDSKENSPIPPYSCKQRFSVTRECPVSGSSTNSRMPDQSFPRRNEFQLSSQSIEKSKIGSLVHDAAAFYDEQLSGHKIAVGARQKERRADDIGGSLDSLEGALIDALFTPLADFVRH
jgi:hypothetical protein